MQENNFCKNLKQLFSIRSPDLKFEEDEKLRGFVVDDNDRVINTIPILEYEEKYLSPNDSKSFISLSICSYGRYEKMICIKSDELFNPRTFISRYGNKPFAAFNASSWEIFFRIIRVMLPEIEQREVYVYSGWSKELDSYIFGNLLIDANNTIPIESTLIKTNTELSQKSSAEVCRNISYIASRLTNNPITGYICIIYLMQGHCKQRLVQIYRICPEYLLSLIGATGSYKTTVSLNVYNTHNASVLSFEDTLAAIRRGYQACKSGVTIVDDYKISSRLNDEKYEKLLRLTGDVETSGKYVLGSKVVDELITGMSVITGEVRPKLQQSSYSRLLFVDLEQTPIDKEVLTELQQSKADLNSFIVLFVQFILRNENFDSDCKNSFEKYREEFLQDENFRGMHGRYYNMYGWLAAMWDIYTEFSQQHGVNITFDFKSEIKKYIYAQHCIYDNDPIKLFRNGYIELVDSNEIVIVDKNGVDNLNFDVMENDGELFLRSNGAYNKICKYWQDRGISFPVSEKKLRVLLNEAGIHKSINGKLTVEKKTRQNKSYSGYYLYKNFFLNYGKIKEDFLK